MNIYFLFYIYKIIAKIIIFVLLIDTITILTLFLIILEIIFNYILRGRKRRCVLKLSFLILFN